MLKNIFVLLIMISSCKLFAQSNFNATVDINISLNNGLALNKIKGDLDFGEIIYTGNNLTLSKIPESGIEYEVTGFRRRYVTVSYSRNVYLNNYNWVNINGGTNGTIRFRTVARHTNGNINYIGATNLGNDSRVRLSNTNPLGKLYIWIGGNLTINSNQPYGDYNGTFSLTVEY
ncbi:MAG: DUF4402 domain-containing protein [Ignavibacteriae bacterium]|nr:DUF4402 domain-containing protein [Ignavibacteriota bacterium]